MLLRYTPHCPLHADRTGGGAKCERCGFPLGLPPARDPLNPGGPYERREILADRTDYAALVSRLVNDHLDDSEVVATLRVMHARLPAERVETLLVEARARLS